MAEPTILPEGPSPEIAPRTTTTRALVLFLAFASVVLLIERWATLSPRFLLLPGKLGEVVVLFDLAVGAPLLYWFLVVRGAKVSGVTVIPVISLGLVSAGALLPEGHREFARYGRLALAPAELAFGWWAVQRARLAMKRAQSGDGQGGNADFFDHLRSALRSALRVPLMADAVAFELALLYYALFSWRAKPHIPAGARAFTAHKKSGVTALLMVAAFMTVVETSIVHLVVQRWSTTAAWIVTALSIYGVLWIIGFMQAIRLRPILLTPTSLLVRLGMLSSVEVPYESIASITPAKYPFPDRRAPGYLRAMLAGDLQFLIELRVPRRATGAYGRTREISLIGLCVDEPSEFRGELESRLSRV
jgi:hypothetical protein